MLHFQSRRGPLELIVGYKLVKSATTAILALLLWRAERHDHVRELALQLGAELERLPVAVHAARALATWLGREATGRHVVWVAVLLALDTVSTAVEGVGLQLRQRWAAWWVVVATSALLPLELWGLSRQPSAARGLILAVNLGIVLFLALRVLVRSPPESV